MKLSDPLETEATMPADGPIISDGCEQSREAGSLECLVGRLYAWMRKRRERWNARRIKGVCPICKKAVRHCYPWWTGNPCKNRDARPLHEECESKWFHRDESNDTEKSPNGPSSATGAGGNP